ncbi:hypothetical protein DFO56_109141 [Kosakonia sp. AG348]|nr:hypothetical protein DFO56_109141 [Kosakonia sp. AG348]
MIPVTLFSLSGTIRLVLAAALLAVLWLLTSWAVALP